MKKLFIISIILLLAVRGFSQNFYVSGKDTLTGRPGYWYLMKPLYVTSPLYRVNDSTIGSTGGGPGGNFGNVQLNRNSSFAGTDSLSFNSTALTLKGSQTVQYDGLTTTTNTPGLTLSNTTAGVGGTTTQNPPILRFSGNFYNGSSNSTTTSDIVYKTGSTPELDIFFGGTSRFVFASTPSLTVNGGSQIFTNTISTTTVNATTFSAASNQTTLSNVTIGNGITAVKLGTGTWNPSSGVATGLAITPVLNTSSTGGVDLITTDVPTYTSVAGTGLYNLTNLKWRQTGTSTNNVPKFMVDTSGNTYLEGLLGVQTSVPSQPTLSASASGGSMASNTYHYVITANDGASGATTPSIDRTVAVVGPTGSVTITFPSLPNGCTSWNIYRSTSTTFGASSLIASAQTGASYVDGAAATSSGTPAVLNTSYVAKFSPTSGADNWINNGGGLGVGTNTPSSKAILDLTSTTKGLLLPRMTKTQRDAISSPPAGLAIYQTDNTPGLRVYNGTNWIKYSESTD